MYRYLYIYQKLYKYMYQTQNQYMNMYQNQCMIMNRYRYSTFSAGIPRTPNLTNSSVAVSSV